MKRNLEFLLLPVLVYILFLVSLFLIKTNFRYKLASSLSLLLLFTDSLESSVGIVYRPPAGLPRNLAFAAELNIFFLSNMPRLAPVLNMPPIKRGTGGSFPGDKAAGT